MPEELDHATERTHLLHVANGRRVSALRRDEEAQSVISSHLSKDEQALGKMPIGERLPYNDYTTIDWLHDLVKDSFRLRAIRATPGLRGRYLSVFDSAQGWIAVTLIGICTACVAFLVDVAVATVSDWKSGHCATNVFLNREGCCTMKGLGTRDTVVEDCKDWRNWSDNYANAFCIYVGVAIVFGVLSSSVTMFTKQALPVAEHTVKIDAQSAKPAQGKVMYMASGSGIPEIKTILSGFVIPGFLELKVLVVKAVGAVFAVATGMCLGKEGPFVHISTCVSYSVGKLFPKYRDNDRKMRELLSAGCSSGLSVAFGAPIGGVLFSYEEISTYFPRKVLWRAIVCSLIAAVVLRALNPTGTGKLVLFETNYGTPYESTHYFVFVILGLAGGLFGGVFCKANFHWSRTFRKYSIIRDYPVFEVLLVVLATALLQYPNPMTREPGDIIIKALLVDCQHPKGSWVCKMESQTTKSSYIMWLVYGTLVKLVLTIVTFGCKVPSGIIIPALDAGAFFGRLIGQWIPTISPGIFAMVGAAAFLAGVSRMTISLAVIMFELTGELEYIVPNLIAIIVAKWVADTLEKEGVYDLAQTILGHPFLDLETSISLSQKAGGCVDTLLPPAQTMQEITVEVPSSGSISRSILEERLALLKRRGLMDAGLVLVSQGMLRGYLAEAELEFGLQNMVTASSLEVDSMVLLIATTSEDSTETHEFEYSLDLSQFVDRSPLIISASSPVEYAVEMFGKLGLRYLCVVEEGNGRLIGVIIKKRLVAWLDGLKHQM